MLAGWCFYNIYKLTNWCLYRYACYLVNVTLIPSDLGLIWYSYKPGYYLMCLWNVTSIFSVYQIWLMKDMSYETSQRNVSTFAGKGDFNTYIHSLVEKEDTTSDKLILNTLRSTHFYLANVRFIDVNEYLSCLFQSHNGCWYYVTTFTKGFTTDYMINLMLIQEITPKVDLDRYTIHMQLTKKTRCCSQV